MRVRGLNREDNYSRLVSAPDHKVAVATLMDWIEELNESGAITAVGHRVVHGGPTYSEPQEINAEMIDHLKQLSQFDPDHLPGGDSADRGVSAALSGAAAACVLRHGLSP